MKSRFSVDLAKTNGSWRPIIHTGLSRRTVQVKVEASQKSPDMLTVVPGTEILPNDGSLTLSPSISEDISVNKDKMAALKESLLSGPSDQSTPMPEDLINTGDFKEMSDSATKLVSDILKSATDKSSYLQSEGASIGQSAFAEILNIVKSAEREVSLAIENGTVYVGKQTMSVTNALHQIEGSLYSMLPLEVKEVGERSISLVKSSIDLYHQNPEGYAIVVCVGLGVPLLVGYNTIYGGFNGSMKPSKVIEKLQNSDTILVDIRSQEDRIKNGVPLLKLGARGKGVAIPFPSLPPYLSAKVSNKRNLCIEMIGAQIKSIGKINKQTNIVVMDSRGENAKDVARACRRAGLPRVFMMDGGFNRYKNQELLVDTRDFYEEGPLAIVADTAENLTNETKVVFAKSENVAIALAIATLSGLCITNFHEVLKFIGVLGIEATVLLRYIMGDENLVDDLGSLYSSVKSVYPKQLTSRNNNLEAGNE